MRMKGRDLLAPVGYVTAAGQRGAVALMFS